MHSGGHYETYRTYRRRYRRHVTPNIAMIPALKEQGFTISYIGSYNGIEKKTDRRDGNSLLRNILR